MVAEHVDQRGDAGLDEAHLDRADPAASHQRREGTDGALQARDEVQQRHADLRRWAIPLPRDRHQSADRLRQQVVGGAVGIGAGEATDGCDHKARMAHAERIGLDAKAGSRARPVVVDEEIGVGQQAVEVRAARIGAKVEDDRALVAIDRCEIRAAPVGRIAPPRRPPRARLVALRRLDLDDVGAEVGEEHRRERAGQDAARVDHADAVRAGGNGRHAGATLA